MRIIAGRYRGLKLAEFAGGDIRPTSDRAKESLFNILGERIIGARVLDLFCGSGSVGLEALSRGAESVCFNDASKSSLAVLKKNLSRLKGADNYVITERDYLSCLASARGAYDFIYIDPPYASGFGARALSEIAARRLLTEDGVAVLESKEAFDGGIEGLEKYDERKYGIAHLTFFRLSK